MNKMQKYIFSEEKKWFFRMLPFIKDPQGKILKVGNGLGYLSKMIALTNLKINILDINIDKDCINKGDVDIYDGISFPYKDNKFDVSICYLVLHHTPNPIEIIREMKRVSKRLIILEETYDNFLAKLDLIYRDWRVNTLAGQKSEIYWNSYFPKDSLLKLAKEENLKLVWRYKEPKRLYFKDFYIFDK